MEIQLEIEREETRRRERDGGMDEDLAGLHQVMKKVGKKREERPLLQEELSDNDLEGLTALEIDYDEAIVQVPVSPFGSSPFPSFNLFFASGSQ